MTAVRRTQLVRLGVWIGLATMAVLTAVITARTETGIRRIATLIAPQPPETVRTAKAPSVQLANRQLDQELEQRRLNEAIRLLAADRDRLLARVGALERNLDDVTGSIGGSGATPAPPSQSRTLPQIPPQAAAPAPPAPAASLAAPQTAAPVTSPSASGRIAAGHLATGNPAAAESVATKTEFGVDVGGNATVEGLKGLWSRLKANQPALFDGLRPVMAVRDGQKPGTIELRLIAGPVANAATAARLCAALGAAGQTCQPAVFDGQRLALQ